MTIFLNLLNAVVSLYPKPERGDNRDDSTQLCWGKNDDTSPQIIFTYTPIVVISSSKAPLSKTSLGTTV